MADTEHVYTWTKRDRQELFTETAGQLGISSPVAIEKDYWVCWALHHVFASNSRDSFVFKGGTSLSKVYGIISRFSEDIDISIDRAALGFDGDRDPLNADTKNQAKKLVEAIPTACAEWIKTKLQPELDLSMANELQDRASWKLAADTVDGSTLLFSYPPSLESAEYGATTYIKPQIRLEFGGRNELWPKKMAKVTSYCADKFPETVLDPPSTVSVLRAERTFWEKATLVHAEFHRPGNGSVGPRLSRHYYDLAMLDRAGIVASAIADVTLREAVVTHKTLFFASAWAKYASAVPGTFHILPRPDQQIELRNDYRRMEEMFFETPPTFDDIMVELSAMEVRINAG